MLSFCTCRLRQELKDCRSPSIFPFDYKLIKILTQSSSFCLRSSSVICQLSLSSLSSGQSEPKKFVLLYFKHQRWSKLKSENVPLLTITVLILSLKVTHQPESRYPATRIIISLVDRNVSKYTYILNHKLQHIVSVESGIVDIVSDTSSFSYYWRRVQSYSSSYDTVEIILKVLLLEGWSVVSVQKNGSWEEPHESWPECPLALEALASKTEIKTTCPAYKIFDLPTLRATI